jgi:hypothetical protein
MKVNVAGPGYEIPSGSTLSGSVLERQYEAEKTKDARILGQPGVRKYGATLTTDGSTIQRHPLLSVVVFFRLVFGINSRCYI